MTDYIRVNLCAYFVTLTSQCNINDRLYKGLCVTYNFVYVIFCSYLIMYPNANAFNENRIMEVNIHVFMTTYSKFQQQATDNEFIQS